MKKALGLIFVLALASAPAMAQKVNIDYAHDFDFAEVKTFQYVNTEESNSKDQLMADRIQGAIVMELKEGGLQQVEADPDLYVTYHVTTQENTSYSTTSVGYGGYGGHYGGWGGWGYGGPGYGGMGMASSTTRAHNYTEGTLIIDAYEPEEKKMVWRGTGTVTVKDDPQKRTKQVDKILHKLGKKWDKILKNKGK
jgi:hypothetical protein